MTAKEAGCSRQLTHLLPAAVGTELMMQSDRGKSEYVDRRESASRPLKNGAGRPHMVPIDDREWGPTGDKDGHSDHWTISIPRVR